MQETILIIYLVVAIVLVGIILLQQGKGAEMGASFGAGGANTVFGAAGSGSALTKATTVLAILFFGIALSISYLNSTPKVVIDDVFDETPAVETNIESELPAESEPSASGLEAELPATDDAAKEADDLDSAKEKTAEKVEEAKQELKTDETEAETKSEKTKQEGDNQ